MGTVNIVRYIFLGALALLSLITIGLSATLITNYLDVYLALDLAVGSITLIVIIISIVVDVFRKGAFTSMVAVEIGWSGFLMILWVSAAGDTTAEQGLSCVYGDFYGDVVDGACVSEVQALVAMVWLSFIGALAWFLTLISLASTAHTRGNTTVWTQSVTNTNFTQRFTNPVNAQTMDYQKYPVGPQPLGQQNTGYSQPQYPHHPAAQAPQQRPTAYPPPGQYQPGYGTPPPPGQYQPGYGTPPPPGRYQAGYNTTASPNPFHNGNAAQV